MASGILKTTAMPCVPGGPWSLAVGRIVVDFKFVPELYYDLLARILPGSLLVLTGAVALDLIGYGFFRDSSSVVVIALAVLCSY